MVCQNVQHLAAFFFTARLYAMPQHVLVAGLMHSFFEDESTTLSGFLQRPTGQDAGYFGDILLAVAAIHPERVQFHQFPAIVLVQTATLLGLLHGCGTPWSRLPAPVVVVVAPGNAVGKIRIWPHA